VNGKCLKLVQNIKNSGQEKQPTNSRVDRKNTFQNSPDFIIHGEFNQSFETSDYCGAEFG
jgi:hypothetical protein